MEEQLHFVPSRVEGLSGVTGVTVFPDRMELVCDKGVVVHRFVDIARWPKPSVLWRLLYRIGVRPRWLPVANRDWFHEPADMFFQFYTVPRLKIFMPLDERKEGYASSYFARIQNVIGLGGFATFDLG